MILKLFPTALFLLTSHGTLAKTCRYEEVKFHSPEIEAQVFLYRSQETRETQKPLKSLIIIPPTGRTNFIDRRYAQIFCDAGYDVYLLHGWTDDTETTTELEIHEHFYGQAQKAMKVVIDQIPQSSFIGVLGTSVGGLHAAISAGYQNRLNAVFVITAGIPVAEVIVNSDQEAMKYLKRERQKRYGFSSAEENVQAIDKAFHYEPQQLSEKYKKIKLGMVIGLNDETVPTENQKKLETFWKPHKVIQFSSNHFWSIVKSWLFKSDEILQFFEESAQSAH